MSENLKKTFSTKFYIYDYKFQEVDYNQTW